MENIINEQKLMNESHVFVFSQAYLIIFFASQIIQDGKMLASTISAESSTPLAEQMRPESFEEYSGQVHILGQNTLLRSLLNRDEIPSMILWGPPGCGKVHRQRFTDILN